MLRIRCCCVKDELDVYKDLGFKQRNKYICVGSTKFPLYQAISAPPPGEFDRKKQQHSVPSERIRHCTSCLNVSFPNRWYPPAVRYHQAVFFTEVSSVSAFFFYLTRRKLLMEEPRLITWGPLSGLWIHRREVPLHLLLQQQLHRFSWLWMTGKKKYIYIYIYI